MPWTVPDKGEGDNNLQSILFQEYLEVLVDGIGGLNSVLSGLVVTGGADMTPAVAKGAVLSNGTLFAVAAADATITTADVTNPRIDLIVITSAGAIAVRAGTAAASPKPPARTANDVVIAAVYVPANDTSIETTKITDMRVFCKPPCVIFKQTVADTINTTAAAIEALNRANSGVTIPSGLYLAGRIIRVRIGGNYLLNSGTGTVRFAVLYGGTTLYSQISGATTAQAVRRAWWLDFDLVAQANADQSVNGHMQIQDPVLTPGAPTTGIGNIYSGTGTTEGPTPFSGAAAVDSDAANRLLSVQVTFSVSNSAVELVIESATVELI